jgi:NAD(P)-dependent dehydrogenase (short-subunit alcohol dehydrogenase family)
VTGAGNGIGKACAMAFAEAGATVALLDIAEPALTQTQAEIERLGGKCAGYLCDVTKVSQIEATFSRIAAEHQAIDILLNSAGVNVQQRGEEVTEEAWDKVLGINAKGVFFCCQAAGRKMMEQRRGKIINMSSAMSLVGFFRRSAYCASKGAVAQFTKVLAIEWAPYNITINNVAPTFIHTPFTAPMFEDKEFHDEVLRRIPLGRIGETKDVVGAVLYLASDASDFSTGSTLSVDGGWVAW